MDLFAATNWVANAAGFVLAAFVLLIIAVGFLSALSKFYRKVGPSIAS
ncbi:MAG: hypothetical protein ACREJB_12795 [Planctomycetaceae bacterium]